MRTRRKSSRTSIGYDQFENRILLAGDVRVFEAGGDLMIRGDSAANQVEVRVIDGNIEVRGQRGSDTTINGSDGPFTLEGSGIEGSLRVHMGQGDDLLRVEGLTVGYRAAVFGGPGNDSIGFYQTDIVDDLFMNTYHGDDYISLDDVSVGDNLALFTLDGNDTIAVDESNVDGRTLMFTGKDNDRIGIRNSVHSEPVLILTDQGNDFLGADGLTVESSLGVFMGSGNDDVYVNDSDFRGYTVVSGQWGHDRIEVTGDTYFRKHPLVWSFGHAQLTDGPERLDAIFTDSIRNGARLGTIAELAVLTPDLSTLVSVLPEDLLGVLNDPSQSLTVLAPTNAAFAKISDIVAGLTPEQVKNVLLYHVVEGEVFSETVLALNGQKVPTLLGQTFTVEVKPDPEVNFIGFGGPAMLNLDFIDIRAKNGVVHILNDVLIPDLSMT